MAFLRSRILETVEMLYEGKEQEQVISYALESICDKFSLELLEFNNRLCFKDKKYGYLYAIHVDLVASTMDKNREQTYLVKIKAYIDEDIDVLFIVNSQVEIFSLVAVVGTTRYLGEKKWSNGSIGVIEIIGDDCRDLYFPHTQRAKSNKQHTVLKGVDTINTYSQSADKIEKALQVESRGFIISVERHPLEYVEGGIMGYPYDLLLARCQDGTTLTIVIVCMDKDNIVYSVVDKDVDINDFDISKAYNFNISNVY